jgi:selenocysteine-specific elongation factor
MRRLVLGTAGHIDHGKTALVRALTGTDTDRLPDEKRRGITIDLGFAHLTLPDGTILSIVDVPGHEAFVRNMLAGATGIDIVMLVVAADEGPMPQTLEHLDILGLLGIRRGVIALTKTDLVEPDWLELVRQELRDVLADSSLADAPIIDVSARTGAGLHSITTALAAAVAGIPPRESADLFRMPIDRVFTVRGTGTVVTGTVWSGALRRDAHVRVLPAGFSARIRGLQQHGVECDEVGAGARAAIALTGVDRDALTRGDTLLTGDAWAPGSMLTVHLHVVPNATSPIRPRQRVRVHLGTAELLARVALLPGELSPGRHAVVQLRLEAPVVARAGDHLVVRSYSPVRTIAGGIVLEPIPPKRKRLSPDVLDALLTLAEPAIASEATDETRADSAAAPADSAAARADAAVMLAGPHGLLRTSLPVATGLTPADADAAVLRSTRVVGVGDHIVQADSLRSAAEAIVERVTAFHREQPILDGMEREALRIDLGQPPLFDDAVAGLVSAGRLATPGNALAIPGHAAAPTTDASAAMERLLDIYRQAGLEPPERADLPAEFAERADLPLLIRFLERDGTLIRLTPTRLIWAQAVSGAITEVRGQMVMGEPLGIAEFRDVLKLSRRNLIPLLEYLDRVGVTRREGEVRFLRKP